MKLIDIVEFLKKYGFRSFIVITMIGITILSTPDFIAVFFKIKSFEIYLPYIGLTTFFSTIFIMVYIVHNPLYSYIQRHKGIAEAYRKVDIEERLNKFLTAQKLYDAFCSCSTPEKLIIAYFAESNGDIIYLPHDYSPAIALVERNILKLPNLALTKQPVIMPYMLNEKYYKSLKLIKDEKTVIKLESLLNVDNQALEIFMNKTSSYEKTF